ncbi:hypothetical protein [Halobaculum gomorrense]|uniref:Uncharacterized protein n=1 Tax=Halobaculum gomorrense TaxID=43928 RepID=A0A1M5U0R1_9EURY|nr:hypothetical protein [Halobaculum gomorrense]SHH56579.1 hypothetical protein SAMN05443636_2869 [Halobaculum gomorrense]
MNRGRDLERPIEAVQNAAVEHALAAGKSRDALALVGALETLRAGDGDRPRSADPALTALSTTIAALIGQRLSDRRDSSADEAASARAPPTVGDSRGAGDHPAAVGAAVACERFDVAVSRAATLAEVDRSAIEHVRSTRAATGRAANDPSRER